MHGTFSRTLLISVLSRFKSSITRLTFPDFSSVFKVLLWYVFYILSYIWYILCIFFLKATIRTCHEPDASCSESMFLFSHYTVLYLCFWTNKWWWWYLQFCTRRQTVWVKTQDHLQYLNHRNRHLWLWKVPICATLLSFNSLLLYTHVL